MTDLRHAFRQLRRSPGFTIVAILTLSLGIGATTAVYSIADRALLNPIPGNDSSRLMQIAEVTQERPAEKYFYGVTPPTFLAIRAQSDWFEQTAWCRHTMLKRPDGGFQKQLECVLVSPEFLSLFHTPPLMGRLFSTNDTTTLNRNKQPGTDSVVIVSHEFWQTALAGNPNVLGQTVELSSQHHTVIGVMPRHFRFPSGGADVWIAVDDPKPRPDTRSAPSIRVFVKLKEDDSKEAVQTKLLSLGMRLRDRLSAGTSYADTAYSSQFAKEGWAMHLRPLHLRFASDSIRKTYFGLAGAIVFVLLIVCANLANLMLARSESRFQETALRSALGASPCRLLRMNLAESLLLGTTGGALGIGLTCWFIELLAKFLPSHFPSLRSLEIDWTMLGTAFALTAGTTILFGLVPAIRAVRHSSAEALKQGSNQTTSSFSWRAYRSGLVVTQVALAMVLLAGAGLMIRSVTRLLNVDTGFQPDKLLFVNVSLPWAEYAGYSEKIINRRNAKLIELQERLAAIPGVESAASFKEDGHSRGVNADSLDEPIDIYQVGIGVGEDNFFQTAGMSLLLGRHLKPEDNQPNGGVIVSQTLADTLWPGENPIGKNLQYGKSDWSVVGLVGDAKFYQFEEDARPLVYRAYQQLDLAGASPVVALRLLGDPSVLTPEIHRELKEADPAMGTPYIEIVADGLYRSTETRRTFRNWLIAFAAIGAFLAALGIYAVIAFSVAQRTREFGIRMAVGANMRSILRLVFSESGRLILAGVVVGLGAAWWLTRFLETHLFQVKAFDSGVFTSAVLSLFAISFAAVLFPAVRAALTQPMEALRHE
jgi:putative ABC transport system permease protein